MPNQKGGVKKRNPGKPPQNILHDTLQSAGVVLNVISDTSYKSFVLEIIINDPNAREYIDTDQSGRFSNPVGRLVMKILITTPPPPPTGIRPFSNNYIDINNIPHYKAAETPNEIIAEARVQQEAWIKTVVNGRVPVCPSVADLIFFDNPNGKNFITYLRTKYATGNTRMNNVCVYILQRLQNDNSRGICVMVMPEVSAPAQVLAAAAQAQAAAPQAAQAQAAAPQPSITLDGFIRLPNNSNFQGLIVDNDLKNKAYSLITACDMRLFWAGILDFDLHTQNFILYVDENGNLQGRIIDLGNSIMFTRGPNKFLVNTADITTLIAELERCKNAIISNIGNDTFIHKKDFVVGLLDKIKAFDTKGNHQVFPNIPRFNLAIPEGQDNHTNCQMSWWQTIKDKEAADSTGIDHSFSDIIGNAYNLARAGFMVDIDARNPGVTNETIQRYISQGRIPSFDDIAPVAQEVGWPWVAHGAAAQAQALQGPQAQALQGPPQGAPQGPPQGAPQGPPQGAPQAFPQAFPGQGQVFPLQGAQAQALQVFPPQGAQGQDPNAMDFNIGGGGAQKKTSKKRKNRKNKTKRLALRKTKNKKRRRTSKK